MSVVELNRVEKERMRKMKKIVFVFALVIGSILISAVPACAFPCHSQTCCICTHSGCIRPDFGQQGTYACEELCTGGPLPQDCMAVPMPRAGEEVPAGVFIKGDIAWRLLTQAEIDAQFMTVDPVLVAALSTPESKF